LIIIHIILIFQLGIGYSQSKKFKKWIDTVQIEDNQYIKENTYKTFYGLAEIDDEIDLLNYNHHLLDACLFFSINHWRKKRSRKSFTHSQELYKTASVYTRYYSSNSFSGDTKDIQKAKKTVKYVANKYNYHCSQLTATVHTSKVMNIKNFKRFHYDRKDVKNGDSEFGLYKGNIELRNDSTIVREEISTMTYRQFAKFLFTSYLNQNGRILRGKSWSEASCSVVIDARTIHKSKLPSAKIVLILAGQRTALIPEED
jgi:hypothetical protein